MPMLAVDHAGRPSDYPTFARALAATGIQADIRYLCTSVGVDASRARLNAMKVARKAEVDAAHAAGLDVLLVWQQGKTDSHGGAITGARYGAEAHRQALALGYPAGSTIYVAAADYDAPAADHDRIEQYLRAFAEACPGYRIGGYGKNTVGAVMLDRGAVTAWWQSYGFSRPVGVIEPWAAMYQRHEQRTFAGIVCDINDVFDPAGQGALMNARWLPSVLELGGVEVVKHFGWEYRSNGAFTNLRAVVWHHDASPAGDSPSVPDYMIGNYGKAAAQCWVDRRGRWHVIASGVAYHAGRVLPGKPGNHESIGVETDHTTGETWPPAQLEALRRGTAAILRHLDVGVSGLEFHRTICAPPGRKSDPAGLELAVERHAVAVLLDPSPKKEDTMARHYEVVDIKAPHDDRQLVGMGGYRFDQVAGVTIKANDDGRPVDATVQVVKAPFGDGLVLSFVGLGGGPVPAGRVGVVIATAG